MSGNDKNREDNAFQIFEETFYEIDYDSCPMPGVGKYVLKSKKIEKPERNEIRERFNQMRNIARENKSYRYSSTRFYDKRVQEENSRIFYKQGIFMADFEDEYENATPYSSYFPDYQTMGYEQLRTYFTWRTKVRQGNIDNISLSYAFLYLYELLNNIGVENPKDGLERIMIFWDAFRVYDQSIDKYVVKWLKDYHIYYELPWSFQEFIEKNDLKDHYPNLAGSKDRFELYCSISKYDIRKSVFYTENENLVRDCFHFLSDRLENIFMDGGMSLDDYIFQPVKGASVWTPFQSALFYDSMMQNDRRVVLSEKEIYLCVLGRWTFSTSITTGSGKQLVGYCLKQLEAILRELTGYRHKLTVNISMIGDLTAQELKRAGINLEKAVKDIVREFYRETTKTVVKVDAGALERIRRESYDTQEKLTVPEEDSSMPLFRRDTMSDTFENVFLKQESEQNSKQHLGRSSNENQDQDYNVEQDFNQKSENHIDENWQKLWNSLNQTEQETLKVILQGERDLKSFADEKGIMLEVLLDGINEKAMDATGDGILDEEFTVYEDYRQQVEGMVNRI